MDQSSSKIGCPKQLLYDYDVVLVNPFLKTRSFMFHRYSPSTKNLLTFHSLKLLATVLFVASALCGRQLAAQTNVPATATEEVKSTLDSEAPAGAEVLFDGSNFDAWMPFSFGAINRDNDQNEVQWKLVDGDAMEICGEFNGKKRRQWLCTRKKFGNYRLHLEFRLPEKGGTNAGLFFGPLYELQILDSANKKKLGLSDCGSLYQIKVPDSNAALPRGQWQTYDLVYQHAKMDAHGGMTERGAANMSAWLNGVLIHDDVHLSLRRNKYAAYPEEATSRIIFQDHSAPVQFRNIWIKETEKEDNPVEQSTKGIQKRQKESSQKLKLPVKGK